MAGGIDTGSHAGSRRSNNHDIPLIPFIDFLLCLVAFLLVTAVWNNLGRLAADGHVPAVKESPNMVETETRKLHVSIKPHEFEVYWTASSSSVPLASFTVPRADSDSTTTSGDLRYTELAKQLERSWKERGLHLAASDRGRDAAVVHAPNDLDFRVLAAVFDAISAPQRKLADGRRVSALVPQLAM